MFGGTLADTLKSVCALSDGGFAVGGISTSTDITGTVNNGSVDAYLVCLDSDGTVLWQQMAGGTTIDYLYTAVVTGEGGVMCAGYSDSVDISGLTNAGSSDFYILELTPEGSF